MTDEILEHRERLARAFDGEFALPLVTEHVEFIDFLVVRLGVDWYAVRVDELVGVQTKKAVQRLPDAPRYCVGLAAVRGLVAAVYDLGALLGSPSPDRSSWFFQSKADPEVALLVPKADRYLRVPEDRIIPGTHLDGSREDEDAVSVGAITDAGVVINVLSVARIVLGIHGRRGAPLP